MRMRGSAWHNKNVLRWFRRSLLAGILVTEGASAQTNESMAVYKSPLEFASFGDYEFSYPKEFIVLQDYAYTEASAPGRAHIVVLRHKDSETGDLRSIEINMLRSLSRRMRCEDYTVCRAVDDIVIGSNSEDPELRKAFDTVVSTFRRR